MGIGYVVFGKNLRPLVIADRTLNKMCILERVV